MRERMKKFFMAGIFLLFLIVLTIPAESQAAVRYNLIKDVTSQETPEGQLIDVAGKKRYLLSSGHLPQKSVDQHECKDLSF